MKSIQLIFLLLFFFTVPPILRAEESTVALGDVSRKLLLLESKINRLSDTQNQILQNADKIDQELISLSITIKRHRS